MVPLPELSDRVQPATPPERRLSSLRQFHAFLAAEGVRPDNPAATLDAPRRRRPLPKILGEDEVARLIAEARGQSGHEGLRLAA